MSSSRPRGFTLIEILFVIALWAVIAGIAAPQVLVALDRQKAWAAARYLTARMAMARSYAVTRSAYVALRFTRLGDDVMFQMFVDGNRNGVRTLDIGSHVDSAMGASTRLSELFPGVVIGISTDAGTDPVRIGSTNLLSFSRSVRQRRAPSMFEATTACSSPSKSPARRAVRDFCATFLTHASGLVPSDAAMGRFYLPVVRIVRLRERATRSRMMVSRSIHKMADISFRASLERLAPRL